MEGIHQQSLRVLQCLAATLDANHSVRTAAEAQLKAEEQRPQYGVALARIALSPGDQVAQDLRQLAAVVLKNYCRAHWVEGERGFEPPVTSEADKAAIREALPHGLRDANSRVRTAVGMAIAAVAAWDWPQAWPGLMEYLVSGIKARADPNLVHGALRCISLMVTDLDEEQKPQLLSALGGELHAMASDASPAGAPLRRVALSIFAHLVAGLGALSGAHQRRVRDMMAPLIQPWMQTLCGVLGAGLSLQQRPLWGCQLEALRALMQLLVFFSKFVEGAMAGVLGQCWRLYTEGLVLYQQVLVEGSDDGAGGDDAGADVALDEGESEVDLETLLSQLFELLLLIVGRPHYQSLLAPARREMVYVAVGYMQMTQDQVESWEANPNQYVADEDEDMVSCRVSAELLLEELFQDAEAETVAAVLDAVRRRMQEAAEARAAGRECWWQLREAALQALGGFSENLVQAQESGIPVEAEVRQLLDSMCSHELTSSSGSSNGASSAGSSGSGAAEPHGFLVGRALWAAARLQELAPEGQRVAMLQAAAAGISGSLPAPAKIGACRALSQLVPNVPRAALLPLLPELLAALLGLLASSSEETLHLVLETLGAIVKVDTEVASQHVMQLAGPVLQVWAANASDPLVSGDALEVLQTLAACPRCLGPLAQHAVPALAQVVQNPGGQPPMLLEASLDLLAALVRPMAGTSSGTEGRGVAAAVASAVLVPAAALAGGSDDAGAVQSATQLLIELLRAGGPELLQWAPGHTPQQVLERLIQGCALPLLRPGLDDGCSALAGPLVLQLLRSCPLETAPFLPALIQAAAAKLQVATAPTAVSGLVLLFCRLLLNDTAAMLNALQSVHVMRRDGTSASALSVVLPTLLERAADVSGDFATKVVTAALLKLLELRHQPALASIAVDGPPLAQEGGVRTRAKVAQQGGLRYAQIPAPVKMVGVIAERLQEAKDSTSRSIHNATAGYSHSMGDGDDDGSDDEWDEQGSHASQGDGSLSLQGRSLTPTPRGDGPGGIGGNLGPTGVPLDLLDLLAEQAEGAPDVPEDPQDANDPLQKVDFVEMAWGALVGLAALDAAFVGQCVAALPAPQGHIVQQALAAAQQGQQQR